MANRLLLVDDEERFLKTTKKLLEKRGFSPLTASSGKEALEKMNAQPIQLVILDIKMPDMDGMTALKRIKRDFPDTEVIMLTGHATIENAVEGMSLGASDYLVKPVDINELIERIETTLARKTEEASFRAEKNRTYQNLKIRFYIAALALFWMPLLLTGVMVTVELNSEVPVHDLIMTWLDRFNALVSISLLIILVGLLPVIWYSADRLVRFLKSTAETSEQLHLQLWHSSRLVSIGELATGIAHEINNPLAIIVGRCGMIRDLLPPSDKPDDLQSRIGRELELINEAAFRAKNITRQLIDFGAQKEPGPVRQNINLLIDETLDHFLGSAFDGGGIILEKYYSPDLPTIMADPVQIRQVLLYLLKNAGEAIRENGTIALITELKNDFIEISISDTGKGMDPDLVKKIFKPFFTTKKAGEGVGLSLGIAKNIVENMGGTIDVQSRKGVGTRFIVSLPL